MRYLGALLGSILTAPLLCIYPAIEPQPRALATLSSRSPRLPPSRSRACTSHVCLRMTRVRLMCAVGSVLLWPSSTFQRCSLARPYLVLVRSFVRGWGSHHQPVPLHHALAVTHLLSRPAAIIYPPSCLFVSGRVCHRHAFCHN